MIKPFNPKKQHGQVLIIVLAFVSVLIVSIYSLYNIGQITTNKQRLNDAADAAAYSGAAVIAQGMNYTAYTNRAIAVNHAMIGQMVSLRSTLAMSQWYWKNTETAWRALASVSRYIPYVGTTIASVSEGIGRFADIWGDKVIFAARKVADQLTLAGTAAIGLTNQVMWGVQQIQLAESLATFEPIMIQVAKDNAPDAAMDPVMHATFFGPLTTAGTLAYTIEPTVRKSTRNLAKGDALKDNYLQFWGEVNKNWNAPTYVGTRNNLPNAVGLWMATGCGVPKGASSATGLFEPNAGLGQPIDGMVTYLKTVGDLIQPIANDFMCMFDRQGGSDLVQLKDGRLAWTAVDVMALNIPLIEMVDGMGAIPIAGGSVTSFVDDNQVGKKYPESVKFLVEEMQKKKLFKDSKEYFGHKTTSTADCVEILEPVTGHWVTLSTDTLNTGTCAVLSGGVPKYLEKKGLWGSRTVKAANKTVRSSISSEYGGFVTLPVSTDAVIDSMTNSIENANVTNAGGSSESTGNTMPAGVTDSRDSPAVTGLPNTSNIQNEGAKLKNGLDSTQATFRSSMAQWKTLLNPQEMAKESNKDLMSTFTASLKNGDTSGTGTDGRNPNFFVRMILEALGANQIIELAKLKMSDGVEQPQNAKVNKALRLLADGLPKWFWDVRVQKVAGAPKGDEYSLIVTDDDKQDNHIRRYGLGPLVYAPLILDTNKIRTIEKIGLGGEITALPDYNQGRPGLRSMGKARVFYSQAQNQWLNRGKYTVLPNLFMPYWQPRTEGLSYADKWGSMAIDGVAGSYEEVGSEP